MRGTTFQPKAIHVDFKDHQWFLKLKDFGPDHQWLLKLRDLGRVKVTTNNDRQKKITKSLEGVFYQISFQRHTPKKKFQSRFDDKATM